MYNKTLKKNAVIGISDGGDDSLMVKVIIGDNDAVVIVAIVAIVAVVAIVVIVQSFIELVH